MNGSLIPYTPIAVDFWKIRECPQARIFFLTHLHGDHITGLTSSWSYPIYCSEITGKLLVQRHGVREDLIHSLQTECAEIIYLDNEHQQQMTVTAIDANHCPGAVMFLMQGYFGTILHTGDFRYHSDMVNQSVLSWMSGKVDILYLDNTYCSPSCVFPTRDEATSQIIELIEQHPTKDVLIGMRNLGKEKLLSNIALHFQEWISVPDKFYQTSEIIGAPDVFDNGATKHRIRVVPFHIVSNKFVQQVNQKCETIVILPTALYHGIEATPYENNDKVFVVPYSDHSSYTELRDFVAFIKPKKIIPIVKSNARGPFGLDIADRADMSCFARFTSDGWNSKIDIPVSVQAFMHCRYSKIMAMEKKGQKRKAKQKQPQTKKVKRGIYYDSPKSASKDNVNKGVYSTENGKNNSKISEEDTLQVKRILFEDETPKLKAADGLKVQKEERKRTKGEHIIQNCVEDFDCTKQNSAERMELTTRDKNGKRYCDAVVDLLDRQQKLISRHYRNNKSELEVAMTQERSVGNVGKRKERGIKVKGPNTQDSLELEREQPRQHVHKKMSVKMPQKFVSSKQDSAFDSAVGLRTYSKSNAKMFDSVNPVVKSNARGPFGLGIADRADMSCSAKFTSGSWNSKVDIPVSVQAFMHCRYSKIMAMDKKELKRKAELKQPQRKKVKRGIDYDSPKIMSIQKGERKRTKGEHIIQNCVKGFDCTKQNSAERMELTTRDKNGKRYCDAVVDLLDRQHKLISRHYRNNKSELEVAMPQERSLGNEGKRKERGIKVKGPNTQDSQELEREQPRQHVHKETSVKMPLKIVSSKQDSAFDSAVGLRTYSKSNAEMFDSVNRISACETKTVEIEEANIMNETAKWVLQNSQCADTLDAVSERTAKSNEKHSVEKLSQSARHGDKKATGSKRAKYERKYNVSADLKQSSLIQYVTKKTKTYRVRSASPTEKLEGYFATNFCREPVHTEKRSRETKSVADLKNNRVILTEDDFDNEDEFVQTNLSEFNEHNEKGGESEQEEGALIIVTDSEDEPEEPNIAKKDARKDGLKEKLEDSVYEHDISNESIIAQAGTQVFSKSFSMETGLLDRDKVNVNIKPKHKAGTDEIEHVEDSFPVLDTTKEINTASEKDNSGSCIEKVNETGHTNDQFKTSTASCGVEYQKEKISLVSHENTKLIVLEPSNKDNSCLAVEDLSTVVNIGTQNGIMAVERTDDMAYNIDREIMPNAGSEEDNNMSTIVNIGTQKEIRRVESTEGTSNVGSEIFADLGEETLHNNSRKSKSKVDRNSKGYCRKCELDAFRQVLEQLENCKLKKELLDSQNKAGGKEKVTSRCKAKQGYKQYTKCSFTVKPVGQ